MESNQLLGTYITRLIQKEDLSREESREAFDLILKNETTEMQQGAFLAALTSKGETEDEVAGSWEAIYELDTVKASLDNSQPIVENSGTGMDTYKTFNISTAASLIAASGGVKMARHGARAITSFCGTVDMAEILGVDVECSVDTVIDSINKAGIGLFNGMSSQIHPRALGRVLSNIYFGSTLNIAASLANPALPQFGVRGVYAKDRIMPVVRVMKAIGYKRALVFYGSIEDSDKGMDEASVCGTTYCAELKEDGNINEFTFKPQDFGMNVNKPDQLTPSIEIKKEARDFVALLKGDKNGVRAEAAILNAGLIYYVGGKAESLSDGVNLAADALEKGRSFDALENWVAAQNNDSEIGRKKLDALM